MTAETVSFAFCTSAVVPLSLAAVLFGSLALGIALDCAGQQDHMV